MSLRLLPTALTVTLGFSFSGVLGMDVGIQFVIFYWKSKIHLPPSFPLALPSFCPSLFLTLISIIDTQVLKGAGAPKLRVSMRSELCFAAW